MIRQSSTPSPAAALLAIYLLSTCARELHHQLIRNAMASRRGPQINFPFGQLRMNTATATLATSCSIEPTLWRRTSEPAPKPWDYGRRR
jgi:hypothetical protein